MTPLPKIFPAVLSGGSGSRLWPVSRSSYPKQFLTLNGSGTLLQQTLKRVSDPGLFQSPMIIANNDYRFLVAEQVQELGIEPMCIVLEPEGRNTAPAAAVASLIASQVDPEALVMLLPSDHVVADEPAFIAACKMAAAAAARGYLVTFGIEPDRPETGYGYIKKGGNLDDQPGAYKVEAFCEKPDEATAKSFLDAGEYYWNSGMFLFPAALFLAELGRLSPAVCTAAVRAHAAAKLDLDFLRLDEKAFTQSPAESIDRSVMEKTDKAVVVPAEFGWNDIGAWHALWEIAERDNQDNAIFGNVAALDCQGCYLRNEDGPLIATAGLENTVVVSTPDAVMIAPLEKIAGVKDLVSKILADGHPEALQHRRVYRPWGNYTDTDEGPRFRVKRIIVKPGGCLSLQRHKHRSEHWVVVEGEALVTLGEDIVTLKANQSTYIPKGVVHRLENTGAEPLQLIEVQVGDYVGEDDIERLEDAYRRT